MIQQLTTNELKDVTNVMVKTRALTKNKFLFKNSTMLFLVAASFFLVTGSSSIAYKDLKAAQICLALAFFLFALAAYIWFFLRGLRKNVRKMIAKRLGNPIKVDVNTSYIRYNGTNIPWSKIQKAATFHGLMFLVFEQNFIVVKSNENIIEIAKNTKNANYCEYKNPFNLFSE